MSWNWDKLQERRDKQRKSPLPDNPDEKDFFGKIPFDKLPRNPLSNHLSYVALFLLVLAIWLASGIFTVTPGQEGVVLQFGKYTRTVGHGPHYHLPYPIETVIKVDTKLKPINIGISEKEAEASSLDSLSSKHKRASMFTGDENIIYVHFNVQYTIANAQKFLFNVKDPVAIIANASEAAMREVVGDSKLSSILTQGKDVVQSRALDIATKLLESYDMGVHLHAIQLEDVYPPPEVKAAFVSVASAQKVKETTIDRAKAYRAEIVPVANGTAQSMINAAKAYQVTTLKQAEGEAQRFLLLAEEFKKSPNATKKRMYLDAMRSTLSSDQIDKVILSRRSQGSLLPYYNIGADAPTRGNQEKGLSAEPAQRADTSTRQADEAAAPKLNASQPLSRGVHR